MTQSAGHADAHGLPGVMEREGDSMRKFTRGRWGLAWCWPSWRRLRSPGAASGNHWADYNGTADSHEFVDLENSGENSIVLARRGRACRSASPRRELTEGGQYPAGDPVIELFDLDKDGGTLSWELGDDIPRQSRSS